MLFILLDIKGIVYKEFVLAGQTVICSLLMCRFTATVLNCARTSPRTLARKELAVVLRQRTASHFILHKGIIDPKEHDCRPPPALLFSVSLVQDKTEGRHIDTTEVNEAESQALLNTLTEHDFEDALKNSRNAGNGAYALKGTDYLEEDGGQ
jgi:hypothetical protein